jgi:hypothetical protein
MFIPGLGGKAYALGTSYYVDANLGSDSNDGLSAATPWQSLSKVNSTTFSSGDQILFKSGASWSGQLSPKGSGTGGNPIIINSYGGTSKPVINGNVTGDANGFSAGSVYLYNQVYWDINNLEITNSSITAGNRLGVQVIAQDYGTAEHVYIKNLYIHDVKGDNANKITGGIGGFITFATDGSKGPTTTNGIVRNNISQNDKTRLFQIAGPSTNMKIYNNTLYLPPGSTTSPVVAQAWNGGNPVSSYFYNNIFYLMGSGPWTGLNLFTALTFDYNTFYGVHASGEPSDAHKLTTDPLLVNPGSGGVGRNTVDGYKLRTGSPALGTGVLMANNGGLDYWGNAVSNSAAPNRGAYNGAGITVSSTTLTPNADAFIYDGAATTNYGANSCLVVKDDAAGFKRRSYVKFNLAGVSSVSSAKLRLYGNNTTDTSTVYVKAYGTTTNSWTEAGLTWANAPAITTSYLSSIPINSTPAYYEFDVTSFVQSQLASGEVSLVVLCNVLDKKYVQFNSKEAATNKPQLVIQ